MTEQQTHIFISPYLLGFLWLPKSGNSSQWQNLQVAAKDGSLFCFRRSSQCSLRQHTHQKIESIKTSLDVNFTCIPNLFGPCSRSYFQYPIVIRFCSFGQWYYQLWPLYTQYMLPFLSLLWDFFANSRWFCQGCKTSCQLPLSPK